MSDFYAWARIVNLAICALLTAAMLARWGAFLRAPVASRYGRMALFSWVTWYGWGTVEVLVERVPAGPRVPGGTAVLLVTAVWCWAELHYDKRQRQQFAELAATMPELVRA